MLNAKKLQQIIDASKITKDSLCKSAKIGRPTLDNILKGGDTKISTVEALANALRIHICDLFDDKPLHSTEHYEAHGTNNIAVKRIEHFNNQGMTIQGFSEITKNSEEIIIQDCDKNSDEQMITYLKMQLHLMQNILEEKERLISVLLSNTK